MSQYNHSPHCPESLTLQAYHDGDLHAREHMAVLDHVTTCAQCASRLSLSGQVRDTLEGIRQVPVPLPPLEESYARFLKRGAIQEPTVPDHTSLRERWQALRGQLPDLPPIRRPALPSTPKLLTISAGVVLGGIYLVHRHRTHSITVSPGEAA
jgi:anti-sigma factor RsiW